MQKSIVLTISGYTAAQICIIAILSRLGATGLPEFFAFTAFALGLHGALLLFLLRFRHYFTDQRTGKPLTRVNAANLITLLRISSLPAVAFLLKNTDFSEMKVLLPIVLALVFLTDSFDGQIARRTHQITKIGQMLDSISDYSLLVVISIVYYRNQIVPPWFFALIFLRLFFQAFGMLVFLILKRPVETKSTWGGKIAIAATMSLYIAEIIGMYLPDRFAAVFTAFEYAAGGIVFISFFEKAFIFFRHGKATKALKDS